MMEHKATTETIASQQSTIELLASKAAGFDDINEQYDKVTQHAYNALRIFAPNERPHSAYDAIDALVALLRRKDNTIDKLDEKE